MQAAEAGALRVPRERHAERRHVWDAFRQDLIARAGIALFLFGNKRLGDDIAPADGMRREYEVARERGAVVVPIGATGSMASQLAGEALAAADEHLGQLSVEARQLLEQLAVPVDQLTDLLEPIRRLLQLLRGARASARG